MASYFVLFVIFFSIFSPRFQFFFRIFPFCLFVAASSSLLFGSDCFRLHYCVNVCAGCIFFSLFERSDIHSPNTPEVGNKEKYRKGKIIVIAVVFELRVFSTVLESWLLIHLWCFSSFFLLFIARNLYIIFANARFHIAIFIWPKKYRQRWPPFCIISRGSE